MGYFVENKNHTEQKPESVELITVKYAILLFIHR